MLSHRHPECGSEHMITPHVSAEKPHLPVDPGTMLTAIGWVSGALLGALLASNWTNNTAAAIRKLSPPQHRTMSLPAGRHLR